MTEQIGKVTLDYNIGYYVVFLEKRFCYWENTDMESDMQYDCRFSDFGIWGWFFSCQLYALSSKLFKGYFR